MTTRWQWQSGSRRTGRPGSMSWIWTGRGPAHRSTPLGGGIVAAVGGEVSVEAAGGLRTADAVRAVLASGAARVVVGTAALRDPAFAGALVEEHGPERVAVAIDVRDGQAVGSGWAVSSPGQLMH